MEKRFPQKMKSPIAAPVGVNWMANWTANWQFWLPRFLLIAGVTLWIYWPSLNGDFVWDDGWYVAANPLMHGWIGLWKFWFQPGSWVEYYPIQETVQWIQFQFWGNETLGYRLTNVALHILNAVLLWRLLAKLKLKYAWLGGLLFAVHPVQVESVALISELKNTLSLPFFILAMCRWIDFEEHRRSQDYRGALGLFLVAMLCKISMAPFFAIILLYAWWKRGRVEWTDFKAAAPFFVIALALGMLTLWVGDHYRALGHEQAEQIPMGDIATRVVGIGLITTVYLARFFLPIDYLLVYPQWHPNPYSVIEYMPWLLFFGAVYVLWKKRSSWGKHVVLGLGFFLLFLAPFLGFMAVSYMSFTWVMDHLLYLPSIGLIGLVVAGLGDLEARFSSGRFHFIEIFTIVVVLMAIESHSFASLFVNEETLWTYILQRNPNVWLAHHDLGCDLLDHGRYAEALPHLQKVVLLNPGFADGYYNQGIVLGKLGKRAEAQESYRQALKIYPYDEKIYINLADSLLHSEDRAGAIACYRQAIEIVPDVAVVRYDLGNTLLQSGDLPGAIEQLSVAVKLAPEMAQGHENLGSALAQTGAVAAAIPQFQAAIQINPGYVVARSNLGLAYAQTGHISEAVEQFKQVLAIEPDNANARESLMKLQQYLQANPGKK